MTAHNGSNDCLYFANSQKLAGVGTRAGIWPTDCHHRSIADNWFGRRTVIPHEYLAQAWKRWLGTAISTGTPYCSAVSIKLTSPPPTFSSLPKRLTIA